MSAVVLRADASRAIGSGHVMRLIALADEICGRGGVATFVINADAGAVAELVRQRGYQIEQLGGEIISGSDADADAVRRIAQAAGARAIVVDGRAFSADYLRAVGGDGTPVAAVDDLGRTDLAVALVVNHNPGAQRLASHYRQAGGALLGRSYHLLRAEFRAHPRGGAALPAAGARLRVLVSFGGSDPTRATPRILRCLPDSPALTLCVVVGPGHAADDDAELEAAVLAAAVRGHTVELIRAAPDMAWLMAGCDAAIAAAGGTLGELAYLGRPTAGYAVVADQEPGAAALAASGALYAGAVLASLSDYALRAQLTRFVRDHALRAEIARRALADVDGDGAARVAGALLDQPLPRRAAETA